MSWDEVLRALEASVAEVEQALDRGSWTGPPAPWQPPAGPLPAPGAAETSRLLELEARAAACRRRTAAAMAEIAAELGTGRQRRQAAHGYLMSQSLARLRPHWG